MSLATLSASMPVSILAEARSVSRPFAGVDLRHMTSAAALSMRAVQSRIAEKIPMPVKNFWSHAATSHASRFATAFALYDALHHANAGLAPMMEHAIVHGARAGIFLGLAIYGVRRLVAPRRFVSDLILGGEHKGANDLMVALGGQRVFREEASSLFTQIAKRRIGWALAVLCPVIPVVGLLQDKLDVLGLRIPANLWAARLSSPEAENPPMLAYGAAAATAVASHWIPTTVLFTYLFF